MATGQQRRHCSHPEHLLLKTNYDSTSGQYCDICQAELSGLVGYRCDACDFDIHEACADHFKETISFFAHPWHTLTLSRMPSQNGGWVCDLCREDCPPGDFVYRCSQCAFDVHPLCTLLPQTIRTPLHKQHDLNMVPATGRCSACREDLHVWHYRCGLCLFKIHIGCTSSDTATTTSCRDESAAVVGRSRTRRVAKFLFQVAIEAVTGELASSVFNAL